MQIRMVRCFVLSFVVPASSLCLFSQSQPPASDPQAVALVQQAVTILTGGTSISDVTLSGTAIWTVASNSETANATLLAKGTGKSRFDLTLSAGLHSEIRNDGSSTALGEALGPDGSVLQWSPQNCLVNAVWFFPQLSALGVTGDPTLILSYIGQESRNGTAVQHIRSYRYSPKNTTAVQQWSATEIYLNAVSLLPMAFAFNTQSTDGSQTIPVEIDFSNYQAVNGVEVPFRIQRYVAGSLGLEFSVASVQFNSGLSDSLFAIQ